ncbi:hypothetical protein [Botrimarina colliarenosi]|uniref:hypothetical protein n=1 Tax=Botrimarina colliarenosi TaxID=2528001 RepID=UPI0011B51662|nr:hypothetical protein [Botrimarina colliarenosi]
MSVRYLLPCSCGQSIPVSASQAGGRVTCECGAEREAPRLRELRQLPTDQPEAKATAGWGFRQGVLSAGLVIAGLLAGVAGWFAAIEPAAPEPFDAAARQAAVEQGLDAMPPVGLWQLQKTYYEPLVRNGFEVAQSPQDQAILARIDQCRLYRNSLLAAAGVVAALAVGAFVALPR